MDSYPPDAKPAQPAPERIAKAQCSKCKYECHADANGDDWEAAVVESVRCAKSSHGEPGYETTTKANCLFSFIWGRQCYRLFSESPHVTRLHLVVDQNPTLSGSGPVQDCIRALIALGHHCGPPSSEEIVLVRWQFRTVLVRD